MFPLFWKFCSTVEIIFSSDSSTGWREGGKDRASTRPGATILYARLNIYSTVQLMAGLWPPARKRKKYKEHKSFLLFKLYSYWNLSLISNNKYNNNVLNIYYIEQNFMNTILCPSIVCHNGSQMKPNKIDKQLPWEIGDPTNLMKDKGRKRNHSV